MGGVHQGHAGRVDLLFHISQPLILACGQVVINHYSLLTNAIQDHQIFVL